MPRPTQSNLPRGLITHLDKQGHLITEQLISPRDIDSHETARIETFRQCIQWQGGIAIIGGATRFRPPVAGSAVNNEPLYWVLLLDSKGRIRWEKLIPAMHTSLLGLVIDDMVLLNNGPDLVFSTTDNRDSEVVRLGPDGNELARKTLHGQFRLIHSVKPEHVLRIWGSGSDQAPSMVITLGDRLEETQRLEGDPKGDFYPHIIYRMPDQSYVLLGEAMHTVGHRTAIAHVDRKLKGDRVLELLPSTGPLVDSGSVDAATSEIDPHKFVVANYVFSRNRDVNNRITSAAPTDIVSGVNFNVVELK
jgi:hypothetical protein